MNRNHLASLGLGVIAALGMASTAAADGRNPGSLLLYPEFDNRAGNATVITVTNTSTNQDVNVHFIYIGRFGPGDVDLNCEEFDRDHDLTPNDTLTVLTNNHNPGQEQGYVYVYARGAEDDANEDEAIVFDHLIGNLLFVSGMLQFEFSVNPWAFNGIGNQGDLTDQDNDNIRDLNGVEYEWAADRIYVPRFIGQGTTMGREVDSELILLGLSGGSRYDTTAQFFVYNDNEDQFSAQHTFRCWERPTLTEVSDVFTHSFLANQTNEDDNEDLAGIEYGWYKITGGTAIAGACTIGGVDGSGNDAVVYGVHIERIRMGAAGSFTGAADLPFEDGQNDGHLLPNALNGDNDENPNGCF